MFTFTIHEYKYVHAVEFTSSSKIFYCFSQQISDSIRAFHMCYVSDCLSSMNNIQTKKSGNAKSLLQEVAMSGTCMKQENGVQTFLENMSRDEEKSGCHKAY